jgi:hypothetical protein
MTDELRAGLVLRTVRALLLGLLAAGTIGTALDLLLLKHYESVWQMPPLLMMGIGLVVIVWVAAVPSARALVALRIVMIVFIAVGALGLLLHFNGNREFQLEVDPSLAGWALFMKVIRAKAPPALGPAGMIQLGLLGLLYTYRHPALDRAGTPHTAFNGSTP